jgi:nitroreductase
MTNPIIEAIFKRRSIRKFTDQPVDRETIKILLEAAMAAPTATNCQPWEFVVVDDPEQVKKLKSNMPFGKYNAPLCIVICGNPKISNHVTAARMFWVQDCSAATENMLIAAVGLGLGSVWCGIHPIPTLEKRIQGVLNIPADVHPLGMVEFGYPAEEKPSRTQYNEHRIHWQEYEPKKKRAKIKNAKKLE